MTQWQIIDNSQKLPRQVSDWLGYRGSLTERLRQLEMGDVTIQLLSEISSVSRYAREVLIRVNNHPVIAAKSIKPFNSEQSQALLSLLGDSSLGDYLFKQQGLRRSNIKITYGCLDNYFSNAQEYIELIDNHWARASKFYLNKKPLLVMECFLPEFWELVCRQPSMEI